MIYFKHMSNMRHDIKIKRLISKYGIEGYGLYNLILESIVEGISTDSPLPDLQETCEDLAEFYNGNTAKIDEIVRYMVGQGLFEVEEITGKIFCMKIYKFLEQSQTRSAAIRDLISEYKSATKVSDKSDRREENKQEKKRIDKDEKKKEYSPETLEISSYYWEKMSKPLSLVNLEEIPQNWIKPLDNLIKQGIPLQTIKNVIDYASKEDFWRKIIISTDAFNKQFEKVELQLRNTPTPEELEKRRKREVEEDINRKFKK